MQHPSSQPREHLWPTPIGAPLWLFFVLLTCVNKKTGGIILNHEDMEDITDLPPSLVKEGLKKLLEWGYIDTQPIHEYLRIQVLHWGDKGYDPKQALKDAERDSSEFYPTMYEEVS